MSFCFKCVPSYPLCLASTPGEFPVLRPSCRCLPLFNFAPVLFCSRSIVGEVDEGSPKELNWGSCYHLQTHLLAGLTPPQQLAPGAGRCCRLGIWRVTAVVRPSWGLALRPYRWPDGASGESSIPTLTPKHTQGPVARFFSPPVAFFFFGCYFVKNKRKGSETAPRYYVTVIYSLKPPIGDEPPRRHLWGRLAIRALYVELENLPAHLLCLSFLIWTILLGKKKYCSPSRKFEKL